MANHWIVERFYRWVPLSNLYDPEGILAHGSLKYPHVKSSLYRKSTMDTKFWDNTGLSERKHNANASQIKRKITLAIDAFHREYKRYKMLDTSGASETMGIDELSELFLAFLGVLILIVVTSLPIYPSMNYEVMRSEKVSIGEKTSNN